MVAYFGRRETFAALDLGTTNCRLLIARPVQGGLRVVDSFSRIVRLGEGLEASGSLGEVAMRRTVDALAVCADKMRGRAVTRARLVATEACRRAENCGDFLDRVRATTGLELEIISVDEEARLALAGCAALLDPDVAQAIVFDIGGGSTELLWVGVDRDSRGAVRTRIRGVLSIPLGVVSLTERHAHAGNGRDMFDAMRRDVRDGLAAFDAAWGIGARVAAGGVQMLGSSGTVTTIAAISLGLRRYDRRHVDARMVGFSEVRRILELIVSMNPTERAAEPCIGASRADLMLAGCAILQAICDTWPVGRLRVADRGVREGILAGLLATSGHRRGRRADFIATERLAS